MYNLTIIIIVITAAVSISAFSRPALMEKFNFNAYKILHKKEYYRLITHAFLHVDWLHLLVNMMVLYSFGTLVQYKISQYTVSPHFYFLALYFGSIITSVLYDLKKYKNEIFYNAVGASGAVSAIVYCSIFFAPWNKVLFFAIVPIPGILFGALYLFYSWYLGKKNMDNIGHNAHFWGAVFGFFFPLTIDVNLLITFFYRLTGQL